MGTEKLKVFSGRVWKFGDDCDTGQIIPGRYVPLTDPHELSSHLFEDVAPDFRQKVSRGDIIVAGRNFGSGSSREQAATCLKYFGISAVIAESFGHLPLLHLITGIDHESLWIVFFQGHRHKSVAK